MIVTVPPVPTTGTGLPPASAAAIFTKETGTEVSVVDAIWNVIVAIPPLAIAVVFMPNARHRTSPGETRRQVTDLPAELAAAPVV